MPAKVAAPAGSRGGNAKKVGKLKQPAPAAAAAPGSSSTPPASRVGGAGSAGEVPKNESGLVSERELHGHEVRAYTAAEEEAALKPTLAMDALEARLKREHKEAGEALAASADKTTLEMQLGQVLVEKKSKPKDLVAAWDKKMKGCVNKLEFSQGVRSLGITADNRRLGALFGRFDADGGGTLDAAELKEALAMLKETAAAYNTEAARVSALQGRITDRIAKIRHARKATKEAEAANAAVAEMRRAYTERARDRGPAATSSISTTTTSSSTTTTSTASTSSTAANELQHFSQLLTISEDDPGLGGTSISAEPHVLLGEEGKAAAASNLQPPADRKATLADGGGTSNSSSSSSSSSSSMSVGVDSTASTGGGAAPSAAASNLLAVVEAEAAAVEVVDPAVAVEVVVDDEASAELRAAEASAKALEASAISLQETISKEIAEEAWSELKAKAAAHHKKAEKARREAAAAARMAAEEAERAAKAADEAAQRREDAAPIESSAALEARASALRDELVGLNAGAAGNAAGGAAAGAAAGAGSGGGGGGGGGGGAAAKKELTLDKELAEVLVKKKANPRDLVLEWDRKHKGEISKVEFRQGVRGLGIKADNKELDALFDSIDSDGGGSLDVPELKDALKQMQEAEEQALEEQARVLRLKGRIGQKLGLIDRVIAVTRAAENALSSLGAGKEALSYKREALKRQRELAEQEEAWKREEAEAAEDEARRALEKAALEEEANRKAAEKAAKKAEKERLEKAERERRLEEKNRKSLAK